MATILVVDDEADVRTYLRVLFGKHGWNVETADNGETGFEKAKEVRPDLIFLDLLMPKRSGIMTYRRLKKDPELVDTPVVILTGLAQYSSYFGQDLDGLPEPEAFVEKQTERDELVRVVRELLDGQG